VAVTALIGAFAIAVGGRPAAAQQAPAPSPAVEAPQVPPEDAAAGAPSDRLRVYLEDCDCFQTYLRDEIDWVDFVRQPQDADVHLLSSTQSTGGGGRQTVLRFIGVGRFNGQDFDLRALSLPADTENRVREIVFQTVVVGLLNYLGREGLPEGFVLGVRHEEAEGAVQAPADDPWNLWVFEIGADVSVSAEESNQERQWQVDASADRVTEAWKIALGISADQQNETFDLDEEDPFEVTQRERSLDWFVARSLGPHWSVGLDGRVESSTFGNTRFSAQLAPAVEYSVFPYEQYATRQFRIQYELGAEHAKYEEITLFGKLRETLARQELSATLDQRQPWGSLQVRAEWSQYLHDRTKYRIEVDGELSFRIARGFEVEVEGSASRIRDQLSLPRRDATPEEILLRLRELQSGYDLQFEVGLSYSFGSIFNNVVNPRFGNGGGGGGGGGGGN
jgi:hypothetical protein